MRYAVLVSLIAAAVGGCATLQAAGARSTEEVLSAAGFRVEAADTPEKLADLQTPPARQVLAETRDGKTSYVYRDPSACRCLYVGGEAEYQQYQRLRLEKAIADERSSPDMGWGWGPDGAWSVWRPWP
jgi:hypothetical protein